MCFYNDDYDWYAEVQIVSEWSFGLPTACIECGTKIGYGDWRRHLFQQQHEACMVCEWGEADEPCDLHNYGERYECDTCADCAKILKAVEAEEIDANCPPHARQPMVGELGETLRYDDDKRYVHRALTMFPEVASARLVKHLVVE